MNPLSIVLLALKGAASAIELSENFITNQSVLKVMGTVDSALKTAISLLGSFSAELGAGIKDGKIDAADPDMGGLKVSEPKQQY